MSQHVYHLGVHAAGAQTGALVELLQDVLPLLAAVAARGLLLGVLQALLLLRGRVGGAQQVHHCDHAGDVLARAVAARVPTPPEEAAERSSKEALIRLVVGSSQ